MERYTRKDAYSAFARLASALGKTWSDDRGNLWRGQAHEPQAAGRLWEQVSQSASLSPTRSQTHVGAWTLNYNPVYGGFVIEEMATPGGGVFQPFGSQRRKAREFCGAVRFALDALWIKEG
jgi:hypothetical protein